MDTYYVVWGVSDGVYIWIRLYNEFDRLIGGPLQIPVNSTRADAEAKLVDLDWPFEGANFVHEGNCPEPV